MKWRGAAGRTVVGGIIGAAAAGVVALASGRLAPAPVAPISATYPGQLPNPVLSPGVADPASTLQVVCTQPTSARRSVSEATKAKVYAEYGVTSHPAGSYEVDHIIPLTIGGSNNIKNLFPEPAAPTPGFHQKDVLEVRLHTLVCDHYPQPGTLDLAQAQREIATNWVAAYNLYVAGTRTGSVADTD